MAIDFDALDLVRTRNKAKMYEQQKKHEMFIDGRKQLDSLANAYNRATNEQFKKVYKQKWFELIKIYANKIERKQ